jgi:hypothetical protein
LSALPASRGCVGAAYRLCGCYRASTRAFFEQAVARSGWPPLTHTSNVNDAPYIRRCWCSSDADHKVPKEHPLEGSTDYVMLTTTSNPVHLYATAHVTALHSQQSPTVRFHCWHPVCTSWALRLRCVVLTGGAGCSLGRSSGGEREPFRLPSTLRVRSLPPSSWAQDSAFSTPPPLCRPSRASGVREKPMAGKGFETEPRRLHSREATSRTSTTTTG